MDTNQKRGKDGNNRTSCTNNGHWSLISPVWIKCFDWLVQRVCDNNHKMKQKILWMQSISLLIWTPNIKQELFFSWAGFYQHKRSKNKMYAILWFLLERERWLDCVLAIHLYFVLLVLRCFVLNSGCVLMLVAGEGGGWLIWKCSWDSIVLCFSQVLRRSVPYSDVTRERWLLLMLRQFTSCAEWSGGG